MIPSRTTARQIALFSIFLVRRDVAVRVVGEVPWIEVHVQEIPAARGSARHGGRLRPRERAGICEGGARGGGSGAAANFSNKPRAV